MPLIRNELVIESGEQIEVLIKLWATVEVKKCGIHVLVDKPNVMEEYVTLKKFGEGVIFYLFNCFLLVAL
jgi:hypoxanthine-guanine phosphoribosyltransferase